MKKLRYLVTILFISLILSGMSSCVVRHYGDNGRHRGWYQRSHQVRPHQRTKVVIFKENRGQGSHQNNGYKNNGNKNKSKKNHKR